MASLPRLDAAVVCVFTRVKVDEPQDKCASSAEGALWASASLLSLSLKLSGEALFALPPVKDLNHRLFDAQIGVV